MIACNGVAQEDLLGEAIHLRRARSVEDSLCDLRPGSHPYP